MVIKKSLLGAQDNPLRMLTQSRPYETQIEPNKPALTDEQSSERQDEAKIRINRSMSAQKSKIQMG